MNNLVKIAQAQNQIAQLLLAQAGVTEYKADWLTNAKTVTRDASGRFASKGTGDKSQSNTPNPETNLFGFDFKNIKTTVLSTRDEVIAALDRVKTGIDEFKNSKQGKQALEIASRVMTDGVPAAVYIATTFGPDVAIGLALGESIPIILGGAAVFALASKLAEGKLKELNLDKPWIKAGVNLGISMLTADFVRGFAMGFKAAKFGAQGVYQIVQAGKTADDLKNTFKAVQGELGALRKSAKTALEQARQDRFLHSLTLTAQTTAGKPIGKFFGDLAEYAGGFVRTPGENLARHVERELQGVGGALTEAGVDTKALSKRFAELSDLSDVPLIHREKRIAHVKTLVKRAKEIPQALKNVDSPEIKEIENYLGSLSKEFSARRRAGEDINDLYGDPYFLEGMLKTDRANELEFGVEWRAQLLNSEIKHGKNLDDFMHSVTSKRRALRERYEAFLGSLVKKKSESSKFPPATDKYFLQFKPQKIQPGDDFWEPWASKDIRDSVAKDCIKAAKLFGRLSSVDVSTKLGSFGPRAFQVRDLINVANGDRTILWHELSHIVERRLEHGFELSSAFRHIRTAKPGLDDMARLGMPGEKAVFDNFYHPYTGKMYVGNATEILSTGAEKLATAEGLHHLGTVDREHLMFFLGALDG